MDNEDEEEEYQQIWKVKVRSNWTRFQATRNGIEKNS